ncbi:hypothetical protein TNCV_4377491 [Trichonephila clavipes]|nr:hypothetical protein TNCV_4377491 [Trichonephila clavipes]
MFRQLRDLQPSGLQPESFSEDLDLCILHWNVSGFSQPKRFNNLMACDLNSSRRLLICAPCNGMLVAFLSLKDCSTFWLVI